MYKKHYGERLVRRRLGVTKPASPSENKFKDVDCYWLHGGQWRSVSIKIQNAAKQSGFVAFETEVLYNQIWRTSWFTTGSADFYAILVGKNLYVVPTAWVKAFVAEHGWVYQSRLKTATKESQKRLGHPHKDAKLGFLAVESLKEWRYPYDKTRAK
jgi:hypothetical protein